VPPPNVTLNDRIMMLLVNSHKLKMAAATPGREYNWRAAIIEGLRAGRSPTEIIKFLGYPRSIVYDVVAKYSASEQSNESSSTPARKSHSKERTARIPAVIERIQALISEDPGQSLQKLTSIGKCSEAEWKLLCLEGHMFFSRMVQQLTRAIWSKTGSQKISIYFGPRNSGLLIAQI